MKWFRELFKKNAQEEIVQVIHIEEFVEMIPNEKLMGINISNNITFSEKGWKGYCKKKLGYCKEKLIVIYVWIKKNLNYIIIAIGLLISPVGFKKQESYMPPQ
jgi:hypothetical protein